MCSLSHSFLGKRILITGGAKGVGEAIVCKFYNDGAILFVMDRDESALDELKTKLPKINTIHADLTDWNATKATVMALSPLDHLVNNAGIFEGTSILEITQEVIDKVLAINTTAVIGVTQAFVNGNIKAGTEKGTTIVNISSICSEKVFFGSVAYSASKAACTSITKSTALELGHLNIRANCVCPTFMDTELVRNIDDEIIKRAQVIKGRTVLKDRELDVKDVADAVLFLSSPLSAMMTGTSMFLDVGIFTC